MQISRLLWALNNDTVNSTLGLLSTFVDILDIALLQCKQGNVTDE